jgi:putative oxidoreductase
MMKNMLGCGCSKTWGDVALLIMRVALGLIFVYHGWDKIGTQGMDAVAGFLGSIGFPFSMLFAYILAYGELIAGIMLIAGAFTHWAAKFCVIVATVAFFLVHMKGGFSINGGGYEYIMLIFAASFSLMTTGAGKYSLDGTALKEYACCCTDGSCKVH